MSGGSEPFSEKGRENFDIAFCPFGHDMGDHFQIVEDCFRCKEKNPVSFQSCENKYREYCERGRR